MWLYIWESTINSIHIWWLESMTSKLTQDSQLMVQNLCIPAPADEKMILTHCYSRLLCDFQWFVRLQLLRYSTCTFMYQSIPKPPIPPPSRAIPGHLTRTQLRTVGNLTQNEAHPVGHLTFVSNRLSAVRSKRITKFFDSARELRSRVIALVNSTWVFLLLSFYRVISWNMALFKVWRIDWYIIVLPFNC